MLASSAVLAAFNISSKEIMGLFWTCPLIVGGCIQLISFFN